LRITWRGLLLVLVFLAVAGGNAYAQTPSAPGSSGAAMSGTLGGSPPPVAKPVVPVAPVTRPVTPVAPVANNGVLTPVNIAPPPAFRPIYLSSKSSSYDIAPSAKIFEDASKQMSFAQIMAQFRAGQGTPASGNPIYLGYTQRGYWIVFGVYNRNPAKTQWVLNFGNRMSGTIGVADRIATFSDISADHPIMIDGRLAAYKQQVKGQERNAVPFNFEPNQGRIIGVYVEPAAGVPLALDMHLEEPTVFTQAYDQYSLQSNVVRAGAAAVCILYLFFWFNYRQAIPACLLAYVVAQYFIFMTSDEIVPRGNNTAAQYMELLHAAAAIAALGLSRQVLFGRDKSSKHRNILTFAAIAIAVLAVAGSMISALSGPINTVLIRLLPVAVPALITVLGAYSVLKAERAQSIAYTFAWALLLAGAVMTEAAASGMSAYSVSGMNFYWICFVLHLSLLSFSSLRNLTVTEAMHLHEMTEAKRRREEEMEMRKTKELADQTRMLGVLQREKELMADLRSREQERIQAMRRAKEASDSANKAKSDFLAVISHEIRTPMTGVMGMIRLLLDTPLSDKQKEYAKTIQYSGDALLTLLNDILDLSKVEEGKMSIENIDFDLNKLAESVVLLMSGRAEEKKIYLKAELDPECPTALKGDPTRLRQIMLNLISNAIKFTDKGGVTLIIKAHDKTAKKPRIYFGVKDSGIGITEDVQKKLFQPYQQADSATARKFGGTGLGLSICKRLVEAMGSSIQIASKIGEGTVFYFILSMEYGVGEAQLAAEAAAAGVIPLKLLVVDDNIINQRVVAGLLEKDNHKIVTVGGAEAAMQELKNIAFDVILMDMEMPQIDGVMATQMIRRLPDPAKSKTTIIAMTGNVGKEDIQRCRDAGMDDYISKPVNPEVLRKLLIQYGKKKYPNQQPVVQPPAVSAVMSTPPAAAPAAPVAAPSLAKPADAPVAAAAPAAPAAAIPETPPAPAAPAAPPVNMAIFEQQKLFSTDVLGGLKGSLGKDQMDEMMLGLYEKTEELIGTAEKAIEAKDLKALQGAGHDIKGMTSNFGLTAISDLGARLERQAKENFAIDILADIVKKMRPTYYDTRSIVEKWMKI
jgi:signal transduction histidine kinase/DNA-binding NarL/FixJ family response regulator/HPt (histidine-containing phosphotransfer) domain-containing protein